MCGRLLASRARLEFKSSGLVLSSLGLYLGFQWINMVFLILPSRWFEFMGICTSE